MSAISSRLRGGSGRSPGARAAAIERDKFHDECGVFGVFGHPEAANLTYLGLHALQHRGQEAAGIVTSDGTRLRVERGLGEVPEAFDEEKLTWEMDFFVKHFLEHYRGLALAPPVREPLRHELVRLASELAALPRVLCHRDYHSRNLMVHGGLLYVIDFQDAVYGPITYDIVSLTRDAFVSWEEERVMDWTARYWEKARKCSLPVDPDFGAFYRDFEWMGLQRHLKVLGIFARIHYRDGKRGYLEDTPRFLNYARAVAERYRELAPLARLLDQIGSRVPATAGSERRDT